MVKAYSLTCIVFLGALPMVIMTVLYSRVVYSLWIKEEQSTSTQKVLRERKINVTISQNVEHAMSRELISVFNREGKFK